MVLCLREQDKKIVSPYLCARNDQPEVLTQTCNDQPCPPRWNVSEFQPCSQSCGIGLQMREVNCIHEVTEGNTAIVPSNMCPQPPPTDRKQCNMVDCPTEWRTSEWSKVRAQRRRGLWATHNVIIIVRRRVVRFVFASVFKTFMSVLFSFRLAVY